MKRNRTSKFCGLALAALMLGSASLAFAQTVDTVVDTFDTGTAGVMPPECTHWYGSSLMAWDPSEDSNTNGGGSLYIDSTFTSSSDTPLANSICFSHYNTDGTNYYYDNLWYNGVTNVPLSQFKAVHFDIMWDNTSTMTIDQFNDPTLISSSLSGSIPGLEICVAGLGTTSPQPVVLATTNIPTAASNGWVTMTLPINPNQAGIDGAAGIYFHKWLNNSGSLAATYDAFFWIDNVWFEGNAAPPPPPTIQPPVKPTPGLNVLSVSPGLYDRHEAALVQSNALSWVGHASLANPVTYSFTINGFPQDPATQNACEAYMFLCPNPVYLDNAPDWNEPNNVIVSVQQGDSNVAVMTFQYKVDEPNGGDMYYGYNSYTNPPNSWDGVTPNYNELGLLGTVTNDGNALGTWTVTFTSDTNVTLIAPNGNSNSFIFPPYNAAKFAETANPGFYVYLGMQANNNASLDRDVSYSQFSVSGVGTPMSDDFLSDSALNTNVWLTSMSTAAQGVFVMPANAAYWLKWNVASGFVLHATSDLASGSWNTLTNDLVLSGANNIFQLVTTNDVPAGNGAAFFKLVK